MPVTTTTITKCDRCGAEKVHCNGKSTGCKTVSIHVTKFFFDGRGNSYPVPTPTILCKACSREWNDRLTDFMEGYTP
jgi:hypothetical protein